MILEMRNNMYIEINYYDDISCICNRIDINLIKIIGINMINIIEIIEQNTSIF